MADLPALNRTLPGSFINILYGTIPVFFGRLSNNLLNSWRYFKSKKLQVCSL